MNARAHLDAIASLDPSDQSPAVAEAFGRAVDVLGQIRAKGGKQAVRVEVTAMHHAAIATLRSEIGPVGVRKVLEQVVALNERLNTRRIRTRAAP